MERNMQRILQEICNTGLLRLVGVRVRSDELKKHLCSRKLHWMTQTNLVRPVIGLVNQVVKQLFGFTYVMSKRTRIEDRQHCQWEIASEPWIDGLSIIAVAQRSMLCSDTQAPGHPPVPNPMEEQQNSSDNYKEGRQCFLFSRIILYLLVSPRYFNWPKAHSIFDATLPCTSGLLLS